MKNKIKKFSAIFICLALIVFLAACSETKKDIDNTIAIGDKLSKNQPTPSDINYSLERYNLIRRTYWVNGQREKAISLPCPINEMPIGYILLIEPGFDQPIAKFTVSGKVSSLNSYLTPDSEYYERNSSTNSNNWLPDVDGSYGYNDDGIFFFTPEGKYIEWTGDYFYSDIPFKIESTMVGGY